MGKAYRNLFEEITSIENLHKAYKRASIGKTKSIHYLKFREHDIENLWELRKELLNGTYKPCEPKVFYVYEPKKRKIQALPFRDRIVQHAIHAVIEPLFDITFHPNSYACRKGKGTHRGAIKVQSMLRKTEATHFLKCDFKGYFHSIVTNIVLKAMRKKIKCELTMRLIEKFFPVGQIGIAIGYLLSQLAANIYGNIYDMFLTHVLKIKEWVRYVDDTIILGTPKKLKEIFMRIKEFVKSELQLEISRWHISKLGKGINFIGYRIWKTHKLLRKDSVIRAKRKIKKYIKNKDVESLRMFLASWKGHTLLADSYNLKRSLRICK